MSEFDAAEAERREAELLAEALAAVTRLTQEKCALQRELAIAREGLEMYRDLKCEKCGHHAHPDELCGFCALAALKSCNKEI